jgi:hypothetical protein
MSNKQTAVQWLQDKLFELEIKIDPSIAEETFFLFAQAKQMEKEQIKDAFTDGCIGELYELNAYYTSEKYYNKTYKQQDNDN